MARARPTNGPPWLLRAVGGCLLLSGAGSLVLEVAWSRSLKLVFGSTTLAVSTILVAYMLGLGLGGLLGGRLARRRRDGVRLYGWMEITVGLFALAVPFLLDAYPLINRLLIGSMSFWPAAVVRFASVLLLLLLPTLCMGATLPVLLASLRERESGVARRVGLLYGLNTAGAVAGVLISTFLLFPAIGLRWTNVAGAGMDLLAGLIALFWLAPSSGSRAERGTRGAAASQEPAAAPRQARWTPLLLSYGAVGFTALVFEVCWTRLLTMIFGSSAYAFATMLAAFLVGIALGSLAARRWIDRVGDPALLYAAGVALLGLLATVTLLSLRALPALFLALLPRTGIGGGGLVGSGVVVSLCAMLGPTLVLGALFPLLSRAVASKRESEAEAVGDVYAVNTIGSAAGAFCAGFVLIPLVGLRQTLGLAIALDLAVAALALLLLGGAVPGLRRLAGGLLLFGAGAIALAPPGWNREQFVSGLYYHPELLLDFGIPIKPVEGASSEQMLFYREGINATVSVHRERGELRLRINGKTDASLGDMSTQLLLGHLPMSFGPPAEDVLVIGYASGVTTGAVTLYGPRRVDVAEIEPAVIEASHFFDEYNHRPLENPAVNVILEDGRTWLSATSSRYDVIISEPSNPWISGCSNLFTREFFRSAHEALHPGGRLLQWVQLYDIDEPILYSVLAALSAEFRYVHGFLYSSSDTDLLLCASDEPLRTDDLPRWEQLPQAVRDDYLSIGTHDTEDLWSLLRLSPAAVRALAARAEQINTDSSMFVELHAPWTLHTGTAAVWRAVEDDALGVLPLLEPSAGEPRLSGERLARLARSYVIRRRNPKVAGELLRRARERSAGWAGDAAFAALALFGGRPDPQAAAEALDRALADPRADAEAWRARAQLRFRAGDLSGAASDLDQALSREPDYGPALRLAVQLRGAEGRAREARALADRLLALPDSRLNDGLLATTAVSAAASGDLDTAAAELERFLLRFPDSPREWEILQRVYGDLGRSDDAARAGRNVERARRNRMLRSHRTARSRLLEGDLEGATQTLRWIVSRYPDYEPARRDLDGLLAGSTR